MAQPVYEPCAPWADPETFTVCEPGDIRPDDLAAAVSVATGVLFVRTQRIFTGVCADTWRPEGCGCRAPWACACFNCTGYPAIELRRRPVIEVSEVRVDGAILTADKYQLGDPANPRQENHLFRTDGLPWPCCQDIAADPLTDGHTWQITYTWGTAPPAGADRMTELLACEYVKAWAGKACKLSGTAAQVTRENFTQLMRDRSVALEQGLLGIDVVDQWLATINPSGADRVPKILTPEDLGLDRDPTQHPRGHRSEGW